MSSTSTIDQLNRRILELETELADYRNQGRPVEVQEQPPYSLFEHILIGITVWSRDGRLLLANRFFTLLTGYTKEGVGSLESWLARVFPDSHYRSRVMADWGNAMRQSEAVRQFRITCRDGSIKEVEFRGSFLPDGRTLVTMADYTAYKKMETQVIQSQKMEAIGTLAGGIAHDYNNLLMGIHGNLTLVLLDFGGPDEQLQRLRTIEKYIQSGINLTQQLLSLSRGGHYQACTADINPLLRETADIFKRTKKQIKFHDRLDQTVKSVEIDTSQMEQVFLNLFINAWQAMPEGGSVTLTSATVELDAGFAGAYHIAPGSYVKISVADTGVGMDKTTQSKVFDPFFTTKGSGSGTGLGLSSSYNIVKNHGGVITVDSQLGEGSEFTIYLPASGNPIEPAQAKEPKIFRGRGTILLVDDETMILDVGRQMLRQLGYAALTASSGQEAVAVYREKRDEIRLVILDIIMPDMSGLETFKRLAELNPDIDVLLASGYSVDGEARRMLEMGGRAFIQKPFSLSELSSLIHDILG
jgi:two-component system cell cycle sensor histidine kinase/response regulator CckA